MSDLTDVVNNESNANSNVLAITSKKGAQKPKKETSAGDKPDKTPKIADLYEAIFAVIDGTIPSTLPKFPFKIATVQISDGIKTPIQIFPDESCKRITLEIVANMIMAYTRRALAGVECFRFTARMARDCADYWQMAASLLPVPAHVRFEDDIGTCWNRPNFKIVAGPTPLFDELFSRMKNGIAVKTWIGSLFFPQSYRQQYIWIYGEGNDGKSALLEFIAKVFGFEGALPQSKAPSGEHWAEQYPGKRFIFFPDFKDFSSLDNGPLKQITGGDRIYINPKHKPGYMAELTCKLAFSSNHMPPIDLQKANLRRIIFAEMKSAAAFDPHYQDKLWMEGGFFLQSCFELYKNVCSDNGPIKVSEDSIEQLSAWGAREEDEFETWFKDFLKEDEHSFITATELSQRITIRFKDFRTKRACYDWLHSKGYRRTRLNVGKQRPWIYRNLILTQFNGDIP